MTLYDRYLTGDTKQVYAEISNLGVNAFSADNLRDIENVLTETFLRVAYNLNVIYEALKKIDYLFNTNPQYNFEKPLHKPLANTQTLLNRIDKAVKVFGFVPLSLKYFYKIVGGVNFAWDYNTNDHLLWSMADPIQISSLDALAETVTDEFWQEEIEEYVNDESFGFAFLELSADEFHKDNISGGQAYALQITKQPTIDSSFLNEPNNTTFIDYLRISFEYGGFPGMARQAMPESFQDFLTNVKPKLKTI